ncbi:MULTISPECIES: PAS domain-containing hybrid sensor histidine kinase/response regulator [Bacteroides]|uniref:PAS domain-containing hybrid sensor histidine kinase/response regulator n=1 Tax=Bacteroides TaxID=816 RepID=UPI001C3784BA|nr:MULTISPECIES: PAS domain-containing hybrid sensor histidine kinase/response regulator [Bacteroides]MBV3635866.1 response regulator [Bacteroides cellulosilyticus]MBV3662187.1 response regulator [Bacteroides cellulosilyticus]MBV3684308.1 response regulator [Bacteroides cellulosilyticus]MBV3692868.1 response regulator [Bacteroides cellulosilyticus]MBV3706356.1 response regulator [Bacteroides cellulosilyticus]
MENELLSLIPEYIPLGLGVYDKDGYLKYANGTTLKMFGVTMKDIYNINIFDDPNITAEDKVLLKQGLNVSFETDYDFDLCENFYETPIKGIRKYFVTKVTIMRDPEGNRQGYLLACEDITVKKAQEREIIESYKKIKATQKELSLALNAGKLSSWNYNIKEGLFYKFDVHIENIEKRSLKSIYESIHPDDRNKFMALLEAVAHKQKLPENRIILRVLENNATDYSYSSFTYSAVEDEAGNIVVITFIQRDITEDIIYQQNLITAKNKAEEADKLKSTFLANMSHEIRTPLNAIVGFSELLTETDDTEEKFEYKQLIETNSEILLKLIGDILDLSKIEVGSIDINRQKLNLCQLCDELYRSFQQRIKNPKVTLKLINPYTKCIANFDKYRFMQIFTNFATNAIKYTPQGEIVMGYECMPGQVRIYVKDSGIGIPEEKKHRIFSRFEKLDTFAQGTGLGLSICKAIADATGGEVGFKSKANVGSEFWYIGYTDVEYIESSEIADEDLYNNNTERPSADSSVKIKDLNILIAEDNDSNYLLIKKLLKDNQLTRAITGVEAIEKIKAQTFDIVFMDMRMPVMNGLEATSLIREFNQTTPIIALTANAFDSDRENALAAGCNHFMTKPVKKRELTDLLFKYFKR